MLRSALLASCLGLVFLAACGCATKPSSTSTETPATGGTGAATDGTGAATDATGGTGTTDGTGATDGTGTTDGTGATLDVTALGRDCGEADACPAGSTCVTYYGIAGPSGPAFKSCEVTCAASKGGGKGACPAGTMCVTIADGPGQVCRP